MKDEDILHTDNDEPTQALLSEEVALRHSLLKDKNPLPDVAAELQSFHRRRQQGRFSRRIAVAGALSGAAAAVALIFLIQKIWFSDAGETPVTVFFAANSSQEVTLRGSSGSTVSLDSAMEDTLISHMGIRISTRDKTVYAKANSTQPEMLTLTTPRRKDFKVVLSDGSEVWLNGDSRLVYPSSFDGKVREVSLQGEAYFKVAHDKEHPFVVKTQNIRTEVLGTEFNLRSYSAGDTHVTLTQGSVQVSCNKSRSSVLIYPGQDAMLESDGGFAVKKVDISTFTEWKNGYFYFDRQTLLDVMLALGRWYDVDVVFANKSMMNLQIHFVADRNGSLHDAISLFNSLNKAKASIRDNKVVVE